jgi:hypothetical protein
MDVNCGIWTAEYRIRKLPPGDYYIGDPKLALKPETYSTLKTTAKEFGEDAILHRFNDDDDAPASYMLFFKHGLGARRFYVEVFGYNPRVVYAGQNIDTGIQQITVDPVGKYLAIMSANLVDIDKCPGKNIAYLPEPIALSVNTYTGILHLKSGKSREMFFDCNDQFDPTE